MAGISCDTKPNKYGCHPPIDLFFERDLLHKEQSAKFAINFYCPNSKIEINYFDFQIKTQMFEIQLNRQFILQIMRLKCES